MPSGRWIDSTLTTSAPNAASRWVAAGPAQNAVKSTMRTPSSGNPSDPGARSSARFRQGESSFAPPREKPHYIQLDLFADRRRELLAQLAKQDLNAMTPLEALAFLNELKANLP